MNSVVHGATVPCAAPSWLEQFADAAAPTPSYVYDEAELLRSAGRLASVLPKGASLLYSLKANPQPAIAAFYDRHGIHSEVASEGEFELCRAAGIPARHILAGGVAKSTAFFGRLIEDGCLGITIDSAGELERLRAASRPGGPVVDCLLRINPGVSTGGLDMGADSPFGLDLADALGLVRSGALAPHRFAGLHLYLGSQRLTIEPIVAAVRASLDVLRAFAASGIAVPRVDLGLGCGVPYAARDAALDWAALARALEPLWSDAAWRGVELWSEAGRALVGTAGTFIARVLERKRLRDRTWLLVDGGLNAHNPGVGLGRLLRSNPRVLYPQARCGGALERIELCGSLCTSADRIASELLAPVLAPGDLIAIPHSGAYCATTALWGFNGQATFHEWMRDADGELRACEPQHQAFLSVRDRRC